MPEFLALIKKKLPHRYDNLVKGWSSNRDRVVLKIIPTRVALFKYDDPDSGVVGGLYILNVNDEKAYRIQDNDITSNTKDAPAYRI